MTTSDAQDINAGSVMGLLARLYTSKGCKSVVTLEVVTSRLLPFFRHNLAYVRCQAVACLRAVLSMDEMDTHSLTLTLLEKAIPVVYLNLVLEGDSTVLEPSKVSA